MNKFIAYKGSHFTIEWYFDDRGTSKALDYYKLLREKDKALSYRQDYEIRVRKGSYYEE